MREEYDNLIKRRDALIAEVREIDLVLRRMSAAMEAAQRLLGGQVRNKKRSSKPEVAVMEEAVRAILAEAGKPMRHHEVMEKLNERGVHVGGKNPKNTFASRLTRMHGIRNDGRKGYFLEGEG